MVIAAALCVPLMLLAGCTVGPNFEPPEVRMPDGWVGPAPQPASRPAEAAEVDLARWWTTFGDPKLTSLIERAVAGNLDLQIAEARIRQARASRGVAASGLGPTLDASTSYSRGQSSGAPGTPITEQYRLGFDAGWEIDLFGGVRRGVEAADADLQSAVETRRDVLVSLAAEVALDYVDLRTSQQRIAFARRNLEAQKHSAELTRKRFEGGFVSALDVANADAQVASTSSQIPLLEAAVQQAVYSLSVLLGREPGALLAELTPPGEIPAAAPAVPLGVPADLLRRRPDIRAAEANIHAATARIGVATADLFPQVRINASLGWSAADGGSLLNAVSRFWSFGPSITWEPFNSGRNLSNIDLQKAATDQTILAYRQTVLVAMGEVENALVASAKEAEHRKALVDAVAANRKAVNLATELYVGGNTDFLNVLNAQRSLLSSEDSLVQSTSAMSTDLIALYKALGGGWREETPPGGSSAAANAPTEPKAHT